MATTDSAQTIFPAAELTTSFVASQNIQAGNSSRVDVYLDFTLAGADSIEVLVEYSSPTQSWHQETSATISGSTATMKPLVYSFLPADWGTGAAKAILQLDITDALARISAKATGTVTGTSFAAVVQEGNNA